MSDDQDAQPQQSPGETADELSETLQPPVTAPFTPNPTPQTQRSDLAGVGTLAQVIGEDEARDFFDERDERIQHLYTRALRRWTHGSGVGYQTYRRRARP